MSTGVKIGLVAGGGLLLVAGMIFAYEKYGNASSGLVNAKTASANLTAANTSADPVKAVADLMQTIQVKAHTGTASPVELAQLKANNAKVTSGRG